MKLHPGMEVLAPLLGTWSGSGAGDYPTIEAFDYLEEVTFAHVGKPFLSYTQRTRSPDGQPLHAEAGYLRLPGPGRIELALAQPSGITEIDEGSLTMDPSGALSIEIASTCIGRTASAKEVDSVARSIRVFGDELTYTVSMAAVGQPLLRHLSATLHRAP